MGGMAFDDVKPVLQANILPSFKLLMSKINPVFLNGHQFPDNYNDMLKVKQANLFLGSSAWKPLCGDVDINMDSSVFKIEHFYQGLCNVLCTSDIKKKGNMILTRCPIKNDPGGNYMQMDFMFGDPQWQTFSYWSSSNSKYKGLFRTELIKALVAFNSDWTLEQNGELIARAGPTFFHDRGVVWRYRHRPFNYRTGKPIVSFKEVSEITFKNLYPESKAISRISTRDVDEVVKLIFRNSQYGIDYTDSYETLADAIYQIYSQEERWTIFSIYYERLSNLRVAIPMDIYWDDAWK